MSVRQESPDRFRVDLGGLARRGWWSLAQLSSRPVRVDPYLVGQAVLAVMERCPDRDARGQRLAWNAYRVFLAREDLEPLRPLAARVIADVVELVQDRVDDLGAVVVGPPRVELLAAEGGDLPPGVAVVQVAFAPVAVAPEADAHATVRVGRYAPGAGPSTVRVAEPIEGRSLLLSWPGGTARIPVGARVVVGRPHAEPVGAFVPLVGVGPRVNKRQVFVEATDAGAVIGRLPSANPVQVNGRLLQKGGQLPAAALPAEISLSDGEVTLVLAWVEAA